MLKVFFLYVQNKWLTDKRKKKIIIINKNNEIQDRKKSNGNSVKKSLRKCSFICESCETHRFSSRSTIESSRRVDWLLRNAFGDLFCLLFLLFFFLFYYYQEEEEEEAIKKEKNNIVLLFLYVVVRAALEVKQIDKIYMYEMLSLRP